MSCRSARAAAWRFAATFRSTASTSFKIELAGAAREPHQLEISVDGERVQLVTIGGGEAAEAARRPRWTRRRATNRSNFAFR